MIELQHLGGAQTVTGSKHLLRTSRATLLLDCGLFQGHRAEAWRQNQNLPLGDARLDAVILSHAHIDHSGALPLLYRRGYRGPVHATPATRDLCAPMLFDAASIQESDARHIAKLIARNEGDLQPVQALYTEEDVTGILQQMISVPYHLPFVVAEGVTMSFVDAGHVLGSAIVVLDVEDEGRRVRLAFTGDLGRPHLPILRDPEVPERVDVLLSESTYGDRLHPPIGEMTDTLAEVVARVAVRGGKVIIPSFALERAQEVLFALHQLQHAGRLPKVPVYVDSPLAVQLTEVFKLHPECYRKETAALWATSESPFALDGLCYVGSADESKAVTAAPGPAVIIAGSGMCEAGRVLYHLQAAIGDARNAVVIVGFQAQHTLGRRLVEKRPEVRIFGVMRERAAEVVVLNGFSAHADQRGLVDFAAAVARAGRLSRILLVHGEPPAQAALAERLKDQGVCNDVHAPALGETVRID